MKSAKLATTVLLYAIGTVAQDDIPTFKVNTAIALVWEIGSPKNSSFSTIWDPLTGREIHRLSSSGVEVSSILGYERISTSKVGSLLNYTTTVANNTDSEVI